VERKGNPLTLEGKNSLSLLLRGEAPTPAGEKPADHLLREKTRGTVRRSGFQPRRAFLRRRFVRDAGKRRERGHQHHELQKRELSSKGKKKKGDATALSYQKLEAGNPSPSPRVGLTVQSIVFRQKRGSHNVETRRSICMKSSHRSEPNHKSSSP